MDMSVLWQVSYGMYAICVNDNGKATGCIANSMMQITSENPIFAVSLNKNNYTTEVIKHTKEFSLTILSEESNPRLIGALGFFSGKDKAKLEGYSYKLLSNGLPVLTEACTGYMTFEVLEMVDCETHYVVIAKVIEAEKLEDKKPMTYEYYHKVVKGKSPKNAPTYQK